LTDNDFDLTEYATISVADFPFNCYFITDQVVTEAGPVTQSPSEWIRGTAWGKISGSRPSGFIVRGSRWGVIK